MKIFLTLAAALFIGTAALAHEFKIGDLEIIHANIPAPAANAQSAALYMAISNDGNTPDRLIGVEVNGVTEASLHISETDANGVATMRALDGVDIPVGDTAVLEPGAMHVMLMGLTAPLLAGDMVPATLIFEKAGRVQIELMVLNADGTEAPMDHSKMDHSKMDHSTTP